MLDVIYAGLCHSCGGDLGSKEIESHSCFRRNTSLCHFKYESLYQEFVEFFEKAVGTPRAIQKFWARRILNGESFAAVAPTGIGKTSFGAVMSLFLALKGKRSYIILPTTLLVKQVVENIQEYAVRLSLNLGINENSDIILLHYHGRLKKEEKEKFFELLKKDFHILVTTTQFLAKHFNDINKTFNFIFVDDVDAVLKASRNVDRILMLLGFRKTARGWEGEAKGSLMVSTATAKKGQKVQLFRQLLNFDVGSTTHAVRNIEDIVVEAEGANLETLRKILFEMGSGGIIFARNGEEAEEIYRKLSEISKPQLKIGLVTSGRTKDYELFEKGEIDYLIGTAYYYGTLVRGLDLPERIRFAVFYGAPVFRVRIEDIDSTSPGIIKTLAFIFRESEEVKPFLQILPTIDRKPEEMGKLREVLKVVVSKSGASGKDVVFKGDEVVFPDIRTYIQGSGRTSRLFAGGITKGASFLLEKDPDVLSAFVERAKFYDIDFKPLQEVDFEELKKEIDETRNRYRKRSEFDIIKPTLFVVESPTKAKQIARFFGQPSIKVFTVDESTAIAYEVPTPERVLIITASLGHVTDLITDRGFHGVEVNGRDGSGRFVPVYASIKRCRKCSYQFTEERDSCPKCGGDIDDSKGRIAMLRKLAKETGFVIIGTDPDSEGEKIAWDIKNLLSGCAEIRRAEFHEVTRRALMEALTNLRDIDENLVKAQLVRRIEDRWIGFVLSQKLWQVFHDTNLSAGRAQTPVLGWIIERAKESRDRRKIAVIKEFSLYLEDVDERELELDISLLNERVEERNPLPPYTTDGMLRDANAILKLSAKETMRIAQDLFERGLITYHRTDSTHVSEVGLRIARDYLGDDYQGRSWAVEGEGAHECIRPTRPVDRNTLERLIHEGVIQAEDLKWAHLALYDLIFRRFMASQCKAYAVKIAEYKITANGKEFNEERVVEASGKAYQLYRWSVWIKDALPTGRFKVNAEIRSIPKAPLYTQSDVVQLMKEKGIGRPSTYATILDRLFVRNYVGERNGRIYPTKRGIEVFEFLRRNYGGFVSEDRTRLLEEKMDAVERGELDYLEALEELYEEIRRV
jgi:reverse gyrase